MYFGVHDARLVLVALDPATGEVAWQQPSTSADHISGVEQHVVTNGDLVFNVEGLGGASNPGVAFPAQSAVGNDIVAIDARTGAERWRHRIEGLVDTPMDDCGGALCVGVKVAGGHLDVTRLAFDTGKITDSGVVSFEPIVVADKDLFLSASRTTEAVVLASGFGRHVEWQHTKAELFGSTPVSPNRGWGGTHLDGVWMAWLGGDAPDSSPSIGATSGIADDGTLLWTAPELAPCIPLGSEFSDQPVLCGRVTQAPTRFELGTIERVDPHTGTAVWTLDAGDLDITQLGTDLVRFDDTHYALRIASGDVGLDLVAGPSGPPASGEGWCAVEGDSVQVDGSHSIVATTWFPCTLGRGPADSTPTTVPSFAGPTVGGFGAWIESGTVRAAKPR